MAILIEDYLYLKVIDFLLFRFIASSFHLIVADWTENRSD